MYVDVNLLFLDLLVGVGFFYINIFLDELIVGDKRIGFIYNKFVNFYIIINCF